MSDRCFGDRMPEYERCASLVDFSRRCRSIAGAISFRGSGLICLPATLSEAKVTWPVARTNSRNWPICHLGAIDPEGIDGDAMDRRLLRIMLVRPHPEGAAGDPHHIGVTRVLRRRILRSNQCDSVDLCHRLARLTGIFASYSNVRFLIISPASISSHEIGGADPPRHRRAMRAAGPRMIT
jgi:hypothetical protein